MASIHRITKNTILLITSEVLGKLITSFYIILVARYLGVNNFGSLSFALAFTSIFAILSDLGLYKIHIREIAREKSSASKITSNILFLKLFLGIANFLIMALVVNLMGYPAPLVISVYIIGLSVIVTNFGVSFESLFQGFEVMSYIGLAHVLSSIVMLLGALLITRNGGGLLDLAFLYLISSVIIVSFEFIVSIKKFIQLDKSVDLKFCKQLLSEAFPFALSDMFLVLYFWLNNILLYSFKGERAVGLYTASYKLVDATNIVYFSFMTALFPVTSRLFKYSRDRLNFSFGKSLKYILMMSIPIAVGTTILADNIIGLVYGSDYTPSVIVLQILIWSAVLVSANILISNLLNSIDKQAFVAKQNAMAVVINLALNLVLIPIYSYIGAGIAMIITQIFSFIYLCSILSKTEFKLPGKAFFSVISKIIFASLIMGFITFYLRSANIFIILPISAASYLFFFYLLGGIDSDDIKLAENLISGF